MGPAILTGLLFSLGGLLDPVSAAVGRTAGTFAVSPTGAATYSIPIFAPRGPNGLEPHVALAYDSQSGNGYLGVGWTLAGLSSIYRCNRTYAQDGAPAPVTLTARDAFCMDGQRLQLTSGTYGASGSTYQTEIANFAQVTAYGSAGNGPAYFVVQGKDGRTYTYGNGGDSQVVASGTSTAWTWLLNEVSDRAGNTMMIFPRFGGHLVLCIRGVCHGEVKVRKALPEGVSPADGGVASGGTQYRRAGAGVRMLAMGDQSLDPAGRSG